MSHEVIVIVEVEVRYFAAWWLAGLWRSGRSTHPVPSIDSAPGLLSAVLHLLELADRHGAESEELRRALARAAGGQWGAAAYAGNDGIGQQSLEGDTHDCGVSAGAVGWNGSWACGGIAQREVVGTARGPVALSWRAPRISTPATSWSWRISIHTPSHGPLSFVPVSLKPALSEESRTLALERLMPPE